MFWPINRSCSGYQLCWHEATEHSDRWHYPLTLTLCTCQHSLTKAQSRYWAAWSGLISTVNYSGWRHWPSDNNMPSRDSDLTLASNKAYNITDYNITDYKHVQKFDLMISPMWRMQGCYKTWIPIQNVCSDITWQLKNQAKRDLADCFLCTHAWLGPSVMGKFIGMFMYLYTVSTYERKHKSDNPDSYSQAKLFLHVLSPLFCTNITYSTCCSFHCLSSLNWKCSAWLLFATFRFMSWWEKQNINEESSSLNQWFIFT